MTSKSEKIKKGKIDKSKYGFLEKVVINAGIGRMRNTRQYFDEKVLPKIEKDLAAITGQKPQSRPAKKSVAGFSIREGDVIGLKITLRGAKMRDFVRRLIDIALPRLKDFRGLSLKNIDEGGNLNIGFKEQYIFPEINADESDVIFGFQVTIVPLEKDRKKAIDFYKAIEVPLKTNN